MTAVLGYGIELKKEEIVPLILKKKLDPDYSEDDAPFTECTCSDPPDEHGHKWSDDCKRFPALKRHKSSWITKENKRDAFHSFCLEVSEDTAKCHLRKYFPEDIIPMIIGFMYDKNKIQDEIEEYLWDCRESHVKVVQPKKQADDIGDQIIGFYQTDEERRYFLGQVEVPYSDISGINSIFYNYQKRGVKRKLDKILDRETSPDVVVMGKTMDYSNWNYVGY
jgi:hypothetical protein